MASERFEKGVMALAKKRFQTKYPQWRWNQVDPKFRATCIDEAREYIKIFGKATGYKIILKQLQPGE